MALNARRTVAALLAALAMLCAQFGARPETLAAPSGPVAVSGPAQAVVARLASSLTLIKAERPGSNAKSAPALDVILPFAIALATPTAIAWLAAVFERPIAPGGRYSPYRARAPPAPRASAQSITIS